MPGWIITKENARNHEFLQFEYDGYLIGSFPIDNYPADRILELSAGKHVNVCSDTRYVLNIGDGLVSTMTMIKGKSIHFEASAPLADFAEAIRDCIEQSI